MKNTFASLLLIILNVALAAAIYFLYRYELILVAIALVLLSKWRMFAVNRHHWLSNLRANSLDILVGVSTVLLINSPYYLTQPVTPIILAVSYGIWLLLIKPLKSQYAHGAQSIYGLFLGLSAISHYQDIVLSGWMVVALSWVVALISGRHYLVDVVSDAKERLVILMSWGYFVGFLSWIFWVWSISYVLPRTLLVVPVASIVAIVVAYFAGQILKSRSEKNLDKGVVLQNLIFMCGIISVVIMFTPWQPF